MPRALITCTALASAALAASWLLAGPLDPPAGPVAPTYKTLSEVEPRTPIGPVTTAGDETSIYVITNPGSYYLTGNVAGVAGKNGIRIATRGVTIDLCGFELLGGEGSLKGIVCSIAGGRDVALRNGSVREWGQQGVDLHSADSSVLTDLRVVNNRGAGISAGVGSTIARCIASQNGSVGISSGAAVIADCTAVENESTGISANGSTIRACTAASNGAFGITGGYGSRVLDCVATSNTLAGIFLAQGSTASGCTARQNHADGIQVETACVVLDTSCTGNTGAGVRAYGTDNRIDGVRASANGRGIEIQAAGNAVTRNYCSGNTLNWSIVAGNSVAPIIAATTNAAPIVGDTYSGGLGSREPAANFTY